MIDEQEEDMLNAVYDVVNQVKLKGKARLSVLIEDDGVMIEIGNSTFFGDIDGETAPMIASGWVVAILADSNDRQIGMTVQLTRKKKDHAIVELVYAPECLAH